MYTHAQPSNYHFWHTEKTTASPEAIWRVWTDVPQWKQWDTGLKEATLQGEFVEGVSGTLIPDKGPKSKFTITLVLEGRQYTFQTNIPFGKLIITRSLEVKNGETFFTHEVAFAGLFKKIFGKTLGAKYRKMLPEVMQKVKAIAEQP